MIKYYSKDGTIFVSIIVFSDEKNRKLLVRVQNYFQKNPEEKTFDAGDYGKALDYFEELVRKIDPNWSLD